MSYFKVSTEALTSAASAVDRNARDVVGAERAASGSAGAAAGTPAAGAYDVFCSDAQRALGSVDLVAGGLSRALSEAAFVYMAADLSASRAMTVRRKG